MGCQHFALVQKCFGTAEENLAAAAKWRSTLRELARRGEAVPLWCGLEVLFLKSS